MSDLELQTEAAWLQADAKHVWHPFTQMQNAAVPIPVESAEGSIIRDVNGREIIDAVSSWWVNIHGHCHPKLIDAVHQQASKLEHVIFAGFTHEPAARLCEELSKVTPGDINHFFFSDNGSTAVEVGIKMALQYWYNLGERKTRILAFEHAYHGDTFGSMSVSGRSSFSEPFFDHLFDVDFISAPTPEDAEESLQQLKAFLNNSDQYACIVYEPLIQGAGGMRMMDAEILRELLSLCQQHGILLVADEVMTGFGRTVEYFASDRVGVAPDVMAMSKGLTGGMLPMGLTGCNPKVYNAFLSADHSRTFWHGHSYTANPTTCALARASLEILTSEDSWADRRRIESRHAEFLKELQVHPFASKSRQWGTIIAFDLNLGTDSYFSNYRDQIYQFFLDRNLLMRPLGNTIYILPPYCTSDEQLDEIYAAIRVLLEEVKDWK
jgi:adenosylmethionine-8-amino-7-oxononanoate aminotransferase